MLLHCLICYLESLRYYCNRDFQAPPSLDLSHCEADIEVAGWVEDRSRDASRAVDDNVLCRDSAPDDPCMDNKAYLLG